MLVIFDTTEEYERVSAKVKFSASTILLRCDKTVRVLKATKHDAEDLQLYINDKLLSYEIMNVIMSP